MYKFWERIQLLCWEAYLEKFSEVTAGKDVVDDHGDFCLEDVHGRGAGVSVNLVMVSLDIEL